MTSYIEPADEGVSQAEERRAADGRGGRVGRVAGEIDPGRRVYPAEELSQCRLFGVQVRLFAGVEAGFQVQPAGEDGVRPPGEFVVMSGYPCGGTAYRVNCTGTVCPPARMVSARSPWMVADDPVFVHRNASDRAALHALPLGLSRVGRQLEIYLPRQVRQQPRRGRAVLDLHPRLTEPVHGIDPFRATDFSCRVVRGPEVARTRRPSAGTARRCTTPSPVRPIAGSSETCIRSPAPTNGRSLYAGSTTRSRRSSRYAFTRQKQPPRSSWSYRGNSGNPPGRAEHGEPADDAA